MLSVKEITKVWTDLGATKAGYHWYKSVILGILAGAFIAFAAAGSSYAVHQINDLYVGKVLAGALFATGLIMVVLGSGDLYTSSTLIVLAVYDKKVKWYKYLSNLGIVFLANLVGSLLIVVLFFGAKNLESMGGFAIYTAASKTSKSFVAAFCSGILCCMLVVMAVWMAAGCKSGIGKIFAIFFPIWLFISSGYEHSIANMYYIPAGLIAKLNPKLLHEAYLIASEHGMNASAIDNLNFGTFLYKNLLPVALGNLVGGVFIGSCYYFLFGRKHKTHTLQDVTNGGGQVSFSDIAKDAEHS
ncbi:MAG: formate/nitrite transporter family protein [Firmicutes bacterium]|nr:formate/nitrite transporter family protein [Bacillota bacterium]